MNIVKHPHHDLLAEANREREVSESPEAEALLDALMDAARAYWDFLERNHLIYEDDTNVEYACRLDGSAADVPVSPKSKPPHSSLRSRSAARPMSHSKTAPSIASTGMAKIPIRMVAVPPTYRTSRAKMSSSEPTGGTCDMLCLCSDVGISFRAGTRVGGGRRKKNFGENFEKNEDSKAILRSAS